MKDIKSHNLIENSTILINHSFYKGTVPDGSIITYTVGYHEINEWNNPKFKPGLEDHGDSVK